MVAPDFLWRLIFCLQHPATLDEMHKETGVVEMLGIVHNYHDGLPLRTDDGELRYCGARE